MKQISLEQIFAIQRAFSGHWVDFDYLQKDLSRREQVAKNYMLDAYGELDELRRAIDTKAWRKQGGTTSQIASEAVDVFAYVISICHCYRITAEQFAEAYRGKMQQNEIDFQRRKDGK